MTANEILLKHYIKGSEVDWIFPSIGVYKTFHVCFSFGKIYLQQDGIFFKCDTVEEVDEVIMAYISTNKIITFI